VFKQKKSYWIKTLLELPRAVSGPSGDNERYGIEEAE